MYSNARIGDIVQAVLHADSKGSYFVETMAESLRKGSDRETLRAVWRFVKDNIRYVRDPPRRELVKSPGATWASKTGDCKSMSVMIGSLLRCLGYRYFYRVARYDPKNPEQGHIYPVALVNGREVIVDAVHDAFDREYDYWKKQDYSPQGMAAIGAVPDGRNHTALALGFLAVLAIMASR
ncbi:MAG: hypothetical protein HUU01_10375 [Saprospiraceae bacterium]|nr:hypothetical protein [Saprospiraceae bacterium]